MPRGHRPHLRTKPHVSREDGFILVAVLLLIALATVLIVTTSGVARIESKAVANSMREEQARQNALFGLEVALAQLQREAGPDQRVTATAEILNTNSAVPSPVNNPFWTGVWKTYNPDWEKDPARFPWSRVQPHDITMQGQVTPTLRSWSTNPSNVSWLVSMPPGLDALDPVGWNNWTPSNAILLASNWGTNSQANTVYAPLVLVTNVVKAGAASMTNLGSYAYWVSDEGVKAKISLCDTNATTLAASSPGMLVSKLLHFTAPAAPSVAQLLTNYGITGVPDLRGNTNMAKLTTINGLQFVTNGIPAFSNNLLSADLTVHGYGVACDVRRGGLKQDLTAAFESTQLNPQGYLDLIHRNGAQDGTITSGDALLAWSAAQSLPINLVDPSQTPGFNLTNVSFARIDGMRWQSLINYYSLYKSRWQDNPYLTTPASSVSPAGIGQPQTQSFNTIQSRFPTWNDTTGPSGRTVTPFSSINPSIIARSLIVTLGSTQTNGQWVFQLNYYPMLVLYNPYSVGLDISGSTISFGNNLADSLGPSTINVTDGRVTTFTTANVWPSDYAGNKRILASPGVNATPISMTASNGPSVMLPGEIRVYGIPGENRSITSSDLTGAAWFPAGDVSVTGGKIIPSRPLLSSAILAISATNQFGGFSIVLTNSWSTNPPGGSLPYGTTNSNSIISSYAVNTDYVNYNTSVYTPARFSFRAAVQSLFAPIPPLKLNNWPSAGAIPDKKMPGWLAGYQSVSAFTNQSLAGLTMADLAKTNRTIASVTERIKSTLPAERFTGYIDVTNCVPTFMGNSMFFNAHLSGCAADNIGTNFANEPQVLVTNEPAVQMTKKNISDSTTLSWGRYPVGDEPPIQTGGQAGEINTVKVLRSIPYAPMSSLGQFMHCEDYYDIGINAGRQDLFPRSIPAMSVGGSYCSPDTGPFCNSVVWSYVGTTGNQWNLFSDNSFLANEALFDAYFFSTIPPTNGFSWGSGLQGYGPYGLNLNTNSIANREPLPNPRHVYYSKNGSNPVVADLQDEGKAAANLLIDGAFNVNSTSVPAWKALLTSLNGSSVTAMNAVTGQSETRNLTNPILRFWDVFGSGVNDPWDGTRSLSDTQVDSLAREIVRQVKARGPFLSMSDFLNRRLPQWRTSWNTNHITGALQAAIENTQTNGLLFDVNSNIHYAVPAVSCAVTFGIKTEPGWRSSTGISPVFPQIYASSSGIFENPNPNLAQIVTNTAVGIPGYLMQQDLVQAFAPVMTVRSDTFLIRFYGDSRGVLSKGRKTPEPESRVWGEAVVQRLPEYYDQEDPMLSSTSVIPGITRPLGDATPFLTKNGEILSQLNRTFGRRFKVVSLRWLTPEEIVPPSSGS